MGQIPSLGGVRSIWTSAGRALPRGLVTVPHVCSSGKRERLLASADAALYDAKRSGKNRTRAVAAGAD
jgi:GGDEF domain-containing protein